MTPNMQGIIMAIGKSSSVYKKSGPEAAFFKVLPISPFTVPHPPPPPPPSHSCLSTCQCSFVFALHGKKIVFPVFSNCYSDFNNHMGLHT